MMSNSLLTGRGSGFLECMHGGALLSYGKVGTMVGAYRGNLFSAISPESNRLFLFVFDMIARRNGRIWKICMRLKNVHEIGEVFDC